MVQYNSGTGQTNLLDHRVYNSFGLIASETNSAVNFAFGFDGMRRDAAAKLYFTATVPYDPAAEVRISRDPLGFASGTTNFYAWCGNNPTGYTDPSGMCSSAVTVSPSTYFSASGLGGIGLTPANSVSPPYSPLVWSPGGFVGTPEGARPTPARRRSHRPPRTHGKAIGRTARRASRRPKAHCKPRSIRRTGRQHGPADGQRSQPRPGLGHQRN